MKGVARRGKTRRPRSIKKEETLLEALRESGNVREAAAKARMSTSTVYQRRKNDEEFEQKFEEARSAGEEALAYRLLEEARRRGEDGVLEPVFYQGAQVGKIRRYSDNLLMFTIKGLMPRFRDNFPAASTQVGDINLQVNLFTGSAPPPQRHEDPRAYESRTIDLGPNSRGES